MKRLKEMTYFEKVKLIWRIWRESFKANPKITYFEALHGVVDKLQVILEIILPAIIVNFIVENKNIEILLFTILLYAIVKTLFGLLENSSKWLQSAHGFRACNLFLLRINQKAMLVDFKDTELVESLDSLETAKESMWEFIDVGYVIFNDLLSNLISFIAMSSIIYTVNPLVYILVLMSTILSAIIERKKIKTDHEYHKKESAINRRVNYCKGLLHNQKLGKEIRIFNGENYICKQFRNEFEKHLEIVKEKKNNITKLTIIQRIISLLQALVIYIVAIFQYIKGSIPIGSFLLYINAIKELFNTIGEIFDNVLELSSASEYYEDYSDFMNIKETMRVNSKNISINSSKINTIEFRNVSFAYPNKDECTLKNINLKINQGDKLAFLGENGSGKSTLIKLLLRLYDPTEGTILLNGIDIKDYDYDEYLKLFSTVFQDFKIFAYTIKENICFDSSGNKDKLSKIIEDIDMKELIKNSPKGLDTYITKEFSEEGVDLSLGQKQKLAIARALYKNGEIIVLDEPTASLDPIQENKIYNHINKFSNNKTSVFISHRMGSTNFCNKIIVLRDGEVCEMGTHNELMELKNEYYTMFKNQAKYYLDVNVS